MCVCVCVCVCICDVIYDYLSISQKVVSLTEIFDLSHTDQNHRD